MRLSASALSVLVPLALLSGASGVRAEPVPPPGPAASTSGASRGCTFSVSTQSRAGFPPRYDVIVTRAASATCPWGEGSRVVGSTYHPSDLSLVANDLGVAVSFTSKSIPSGSAAVSVAVHHVAPDTLVSVRSLSLSAMNPGYAGYAYGGALTLLPDGTTLEVRGTRSGTFPGESGSGPNYVATFPNFFTSTMAPAVVASS